MLVILLWLRKHTPSRHCDADFGELVGCFDFAHQAGSQVSISVHMVIDLSPLA